MKSLYEKALKHMEAEEFNEAENDLLSYLSENPTDAMAHNKLGVVLIRKLNREGAKRCFEEALKHDAKLVQALNNLGNMAQEEGNLELAIEFYQKAIRINPDFSLAHNNLGAVYKQLNRYGDFIREIKKAKRIENRKFHTSKREFSLRGWLAKLWSKPR